MVEEHNVASRVRVTLLMALACSIAFGCAAQPVGSSSGTPTAAPYLTASPPATIAPGFTRFDGVVTESGTGKPLADVCVVIATHGSCQPGSPRTDTSGFWWIELPTGVEWDFAWTKDGYAPLTQRLHSDPGEKRLDIVLNPQP